MAERSPHTPVLEREEDYGEQRHRAQPAMRPIPNSSLALAAFFTAVAAWLIIPAAGAVAAIILGVLAQQQIRRAGGRLKGGDLATAAIVIGGVQIGFIIFAVVGVMLAVPAG